MIENLRERFERAIKTVAGKLPDRMYDLTPAVREWCRYLGISEEPYVERSEASSVRLGITSSESKGRPELIRALFNLSDGFEPFKDIRNVANEFSNALPIRRPPRFQRNYEVKFLLHGKDHKLVLGSTEIALLALFLLALAVLLMTLDRKKEAERTRPITPAPPAQSLPETDVALVFSIGAASAIAGLHGRDRIDAETLGSLWTSLKYCAVGAKGSFEFPTSDEATELSDYDFFVVVFSGVTPSVVDLMRKGSTYQRRYDGIRKLADYPFKVGRYQMKAIENRGFYEKS